MDKNQSHKDLIKAYYLVLVENFSFKYRLWDYAVVSIPIPVLPLFSFYGITFSIVRIGSRWNITFRAKYFHMSKFIQVVLSNGGSELFHVDYIGHMRPAGHNVDVFLLSKDSNGAPYGYHLSAMNYQQVQQMIITPNGAFGDLPFVTSGHKITQASTP